MLLYAHLLLKEISIAVGIDLCKTSERVILWVILIHVSALKQKISLISSQHIFIYNITHLDRICQIK